MSDFKMDMTYSHADRDEFLATQKDARTRLIFGIVMMTAAQVGAAMTTSGNKEIESLRDEMIALTSKELEAYVDERIAAAFKARGL